MRRGPAVLLLFALLVASAYGAQRALSDGWTRIVSFTPSAPTDSRPTPGPPPLANRLVILTIDGLRQQDASLVPTLDWLAGQGHAYHMSVPQPTFERAVNVTLLTGALPSTHGNITAAQAAPLVMDSLPASARRAHLSTAAITTTSLGALYTPLVDAWYAGDTRDKRMAAASTLLGGAGARLLIIQLPEVKELPKLVRGSPEYKDRLANLDAALIELLPLLDLKTVSVMVVGLPIGSESVPLILAGAGIKTNSDIDASLVDVAPTAAAILGAPTPVLSDGHPLLDALKVEGRPAEVVTLRYLASRKAAAEARLKRLGDPASINDLPTNGPAALAYTQALDQQVRSAQFAMWKAGLIQRLPYVGGALLVLLLYLVIVYRQPFGGALFMGALTFAGVFHLIFFLTGGRYAVTMTGLGDPINELAAGIGFKTAMAMSAAALVSGFFLSRKGLKKSDYMTTAALHTTLAVAGTLTLPLTVAVLFLGRDFPVTPPAPGYVIWACVTLMQVIILGYMSPIWALLIVLSTRMSQRLWLLKEVGDPEINADKVVRLRNLRRTAKH